MTQRNDIRLLYLDENELAEHRRMMAELVGLRRRFYGALRAGEPVTIPRWHLEGHVWDREIGHTP
jgi:hypothetical protein